MIIKKKLLKILNQAVLDLGADSKKIIIQNTKDNSHGDFTTNIAMILSKDLKKNPMEIANDIVKHLKKEVLPEMISNVNVAKPGFINFKISTFYLLPIIDKILEKQSNYGKKNKKNETALVEFVSANPTGPLTIGHGRGAVLGDVVSNILIWNGYDVKREYYFNDAGRQIRKLKNSVKSRYLELLKKETSFPDDGYKGAYIYDIASELINLHGESIIDDSIFETFAKEYIFKNIKSTLSKIGIKFDSFFNERDLYNNESIKNILKLLDENKITYKKDGAIWFYSNKVNRPQDKVLVKKSGEPTYRLPDIAYHRNKFDRNFDLIIDVFGSDHADTFPDVLAVLSTLKYDINKVKVLIHQFVTLIENNTKSKMSTRKANFITLDELNDVVGSDVLRYFFIMRGANTHLNFDLDLAKNQSDENPVFYIQYAYARICNIIKKSTQDSDANIDLKLLTNEIEHEILIKLYLFIDILNQISNNLEPQILANYLYSLSKLFHKYYAKHRIISENKNLSNARINIVKSIKVILSIGLKILGIKHPERM